MPTGDAVGVVLGACWAFAFFPTLIVIGFLRDMAKRNGR